MSHGTFTPPPPRQFGRQPSSPTPPPAPTPTPAGLVWTSKAWCNGVAGNQSTRGIPNSKFGAGDKYDQTIQYSHAGSGGPYNVDGKCNCQINGDRSRIYYIVKNFNSIMYVTFIPNWKQASDDLSNRMRSRHNEGGVASNRFGGYNFSVGPRSYEFAREDYHNVHTKFGGGSLPIALQNGRTYKLKYQCQGTKPVVLSAWIDFGNGRGYTPVGQKVDNNPLAYGSNPALFAQMSYYWTRNNGTGNVVVRDIGFQLLP